MFLLYVYVFTSFFSAIEMAALAAIAEAAEIATTSMGPSSTTQNWASSTTAFWATAPAQPSEGPVGQQGIKNVFRNLVFKYQKTYM